MFLNLWFAKPMVCMWGAFHKNDGPQETMKTTKTTQTATNKDMSAGAGLAEIMGNHGKDDNHGNPGCKLRVSPQKKNRV